MRQKEKAVCTIGMIVINISIFLIVLLLGKEGDPLFLLEHGAVYEPYVIEGHEYYRLFTSIFLHFGIDHLLNNMVVLGALGWILELEVGKLHFLIVYFAGGIGGNILSLAVNYFYGNNVISAGASGAVFGLMGALLCCILQRKGRLGQLSPRGIIFMVAISLYFGISSSGVDNIAHIGGLLCGFVAELILGVLRKK